MNAIKSNINAAVTGIQGDRVSVTITDEMHETKWITLSPKEAHDLAIEILECAYEAQGIGDFTVMVGVTLGDGINALAVH